MLRLRVLLLLPYQVGDNVKQVLALGVPAYRYHISVLVFRILVPVKHIFRAVPLDVREPDVLFRGYPRLIQAGLQLPAAPTGAQVAPDFLEIVAGSELQLVVFCQVLQHLFNLGALGYP